MKFRPWTVQGIKTARQEQNKKPQRQQRRCKFILYFQWCYEFFHICTVLFVYVCIKKES